MSSLAPDHEVWKSGNDRFLKRQQRESEGYMDKSFQNDAGEWHKPMKGLPGERTTTSVTARSSEGRIDDGERAVWPGITWERGRQDWESINGE